MGDCNYGIIVRSNPSSTKKVVILDHKEGLLDVYPKKTTTLLHHGRLIRYALTKQKNFFIVNDLEIIAQPAAWAQEDIYFLHHILEIISATLAPQNPAPEVFDLLNNLYQNQNKDFFNTLLAKKYFLAKFFAVVGIYPQNPLSFCGELFRLLSQPLETIVRSTPDQVSEQKVSQWLHACLTVNPEIHGLKTAVFFTYLDSL